MKILFLGSVVTPDLAEALSGTSIAGNKMQFHVVEELSRYADIDIKVVTVKSRASFPKDRTIFEKEQPIQINDRVDGVCIPYCNIPIVKQIDHTISLYLQAEKMIKKYGKPDILLSYNLFPQTGLALINLKKKYNLTCVSLLADLPIDDAARRNSLMKGFRSIFDKLTVKYIANCENLIVLNENAVRKYNPTANFVVVDGGIDIDNWDTRYNPHTTKEKNIVYAGSLVKYNGIIPMLEAFNSIDNKELFLDIYGDGDLKKLVEEASKRNNHIRYHGRISSQGLKQIYRSAWLLINPRYINDPISQVTFPSKMFEYLLSGTPVLSTRLSGFSDDYDNVMFFSKDDNPDSIAEAIRDISNLPNEVLQEKAAKAIEFVATKKNWSYQVSSVRTFLDKCCKEVFYTER